MKPKLSGKKSYIVAISTIAYAIGGLLAGLHGPDVAIQLVLGALGLSTLRAGIKKAEK